MKFLIIGDGEAERDWAEWVGEQDDLEVAAACPGLPMGTPLDGLAITDLDEALTLPGLDAAFVGGPIEARGEALRRAAAEGLAVICAHPPGWDSEAFYQIAMSRHETGGVVVPDLPARLHPGIARIREAIARGTLGEFRSIRVEATAEADGGGLVHEGFARAVDVVRALLGEIAALSASGDPPGVNPDNELVVQLRAENGRRAEVRLAREPRDTVHLTLVAALGSLTLEYDPRFHTPARLVQRPTGRGGEQTIDLELWDPHAAILDALRATRALEPDADARRAPAPSLHDGTRSMELTEAVVRSLRRGRTIDLHYERINEASSFKSVMTSAGCMILLASMVVLPIALAGPALGFNGTIYLAYLILPVLVLFAALQLLRFAIKPEPRSEVRDDLDPPRAP